MTLLLVVESLVLAGWVCIALYGLILSIATWVKKRHEAPLIHPRHVFAVVIPTTNAERIIGRTLDRLSQSIRYPNGMFDFIVVPVNSTDRTTTIARQKGATVYGPGKRRWRDRNDAIQSALERLASKNKYDAYAILDPRADVSPEYLAVLSDNLSKGAKIIQTGYRFAGSSKSWKAALAAALHAISPSLFILWSGRFRLAVGLRRIGVCLTKEVVEKYGVRSPSITDGVPYMTRLLRDNVAITYAPNAIVYDHGHTNPPIRSFRRQLAMRWRLLRNDAMALIRDGYEWRSGAQMAGGVNLLIPPLSILFIGAILLLGLSSYLHGTTLNPMSADSLLVLGWEIIVAVLLSLVLFRLVLIRAPVLAYMALPTLPLYVLWRSVQSWRWERSRRSSPRPQQHRQQRKGSGPRRRPSQQRRPK